MALGKKTPATTNAADVKNDDAAALAAAALAAANNQQEAELLDEGEAEGGALEEGTVGETTAASKPATDKKPAAAPAVKGAALPPAVAGQIIGMALSELKNVIPALDFGTLPRFRASAAGIKGEEGTLGNVCTVTIVSYNDQFVISPNEDAAPKELCKFSLDGVNLSDGSGTVADHIQMLKEEGYEKAASKRYNDLIAILEDAEKEHDEIGNMVTFSLSPMSVKSFERYQLQSTVKMRMNPALTIASVSRVKITAKPKSFGKKDFVMLDFSAAE